MDANQYQTLALRTESCNYPLNYDNYSPRDNRLLHAAMGIATEAGEFLDPLKKRFFYGKPIDEVNLREEIGDMLWYIAIACYALDTTIEAEMKRNIAKLQKRYPDKFTSEQAVNRDLGAERKVLEEKTYDERRPPRVQTQAVDYQDIDASRSDYKRMTPDKLVD